MGSQKDLPIDLAPYIDMEDMPDYNPPYPEHISSIGRRLPGPAPVRPVAGPVAGPPGQPPPPWEAPDSWGVPPRGPAQMAVPSRPLAVAAAPLSPPPPADPARSVSVADSSPPAIGAPRLSPEPWDVQPRRNAPVDVPCRPLHAADYPPTPGIGATWTPPASWGVVRRERNPTPPPVPPRTPPPPPSPSPPPPPAAPSTPPPLPRIPSPVHLRPSTATRSLASVAAVARQTATLHVLNRFAANRAAADASNAAASAVSAAAIAAASDPAAAAEVHDEATREYHRELALAMLERRTFSREAPEPLPGSNAVSVASGEPEEPEGPRQTFPELSRENRSVGLGGGGGGSGGGNLY